MAGWVEIEHKHQPHHCKIVSVNSRVNPLYFAIFQLENCVGRSWLLASRVDRIITDTHVCVSKTAYTGGLAATGTCGTLPF